MEMAKAKAESNDGLESKENNVYMSGFDPISWDVTNPEFVQTHLLRFEIDRTSSKSKEHKVFKITDIDLFMEGNRHCKL